WLAPCQVYGTRWGRARRRDRRPGGRRRAAALFGRRHRDRHSPRETGVDFRSFLPGRYFDDAQVRRLRPGTGHLLPAGGIDGRKDLAGKLGWKRKRISFYRPPGLAKNREQENRARAAGQLARIARPDRG